jgi:hypothetical protein
MVIEQLLEVIALKPGVDPGNSKTICFSHIIKGERQNNKKTTLKASDKKKFIILALSLTSDVDLSSFIRKKMRSERLSQYHS